jgi:hypothetical protein
LNLLQFTIELGRIAIQSAFALNGYRMRYFNPAFPATRLNFLHSRLHDENFRGENVAKSLMIKMFGCKLSTSAHDENFGRKVVSIRPMTRTLGRKMFALVP